MIPFARALARFLLIVPETSSEELEARMDLHSSLEITLTLVSRSFPRTPFSSSP